MPRKVRVKKGRRQPKKKGKVYHIPIVHAEVEPHETNIVQKVMENHLPKFKQAFGAVVDKAFETKAPLRIYLDSVTPSTARGFNEVLQEMSSRPAGSSGNPIITTIKARPLSRDPETFVDMLSMHSVPSVRYLIRKAIQLKRKGFDVKFMAAEPKQQEGEIDTSIIEEASTQFQLSRGLSRMRFEEYTQARDKDAAISRIVNRGARREPNAIHLSIFGAAHQAPKGSRSLLPRKEIMQQIVQKVIENTKIDAGEAPSQFNVCIIKHLEKMFKNSAGFNVPFHFRILRSLKKLKVSKSRPTKT